MSLSSTFSNSFHTSDYFSRIESQKWNYWINWNKHFYGPWCILPACFPKGCYGTRGGRWDSQFHYPFVSTIYYNFFLLVIRKRKVLYHCFKLHLFNRAGEYFPTYMFPVFWFICSWPLTTGVLANFLINMCELFLW